MKILVTAGPTCEPLDPVRYLTNRSSGKMGYAIAEAAVESGHEVVLVSGPVELPKVPGAETVSVETAAEMADAVQSHLDVDIAIFAAAVADYRPVEVPDQKIKKTGDRLVLELERTLDILGSMRNPWGYTGVLVGFAAETQNVLENARSKLERKGCDFLFANDVSRSDIGFDRDENEGVLLKRGGSEEFVGTREKSAVARWLLDRVLKS